MDEDFLNEEEIMKGIRREIDEIETMRNRCYQNLRGARGLFPTSPALDILEKDFRNLHHLPGSKTAIPINESKELDWNQLTVADWKTIDILGLPKSDRPYLKMSVAEFFLGELTLEGRMIELDFDSVEKGTLGRVKPICKEAQQEERPKRELRMGELQKSPFRERAIDIDKIKMTKSEEDIWKWLNAHNLFPYQKVFCWDGHGCCMKHEIQMLQYNRKLLAGVIDTYTCILNDDERFRSLDSPRRFFCSIFTTIGTLILKNQAKSPNDGAYSLFCEKLDSLLKTYSVNMNNIDLIFFPIHHVNHYYVICFNLKNPAVEILDNSNFGGPSTDIYDGLPESLRQNLVRYMTRISETKAAQLLGVQIVRLQMKWRTDENDVDCGVFAMRHMETYKGNGVRNWETKFAPETERHSKEPAKKGQTTLCIQNHFIHC